MLAPEIRALGELVGTALGGGTARIEEMHSGIARRVFRSIGPAAAPVRVVHDSIAAAIYGGVRTSLSAGGRAAGAVLAERAPDHRSFDVSPAGRVALSILNGWHGDRLEERMDALALPMAVRVEGAAVPADATALATAFPYATGRIAVFLHGLVETEGAWTYRSVRHYGRPGVSYGSRLSEDLGYTPVWIRYNTGLRVSANGDRFGSLLEDLVAGWPVPVEELLLIGHSMGGLVIRSALAQATARGDGGRDGGGPDDAPASMAGAGGPAWPSLVRDTVMLGAPHLGAPLEQGVTLLTHALGRLGETRALASALTARSSGIKDMRHGNLVEADWIGHHPDTLGHRRTHVPLHDAARHFVVVGTIAGRSGSPAGAALGELLGDLLVLPSSARGHTRDASDHRRLPLPDEHVYRLAGSHHFDLLNHPEIYARIHRWITHRPEDH